MSAAERTQELEQHLNSIIEDGAGLEEIMAAVLAAVEAEPDTDTAEVPETWQDTKERVVLADNSSPRGYFNIRDKAGGDALKARELAEWATRKYKAATQAQADVTLTADLQIAQVLAWRDKQLKRLSGEAGFFEGVLDQYQLDFAPEEKTTRLISGTLERAKLPDVTERDDDAALQWALQQGEAVDTLAPRKLSASALNALLKAQKDGTFIDPGTGEVVTFQKKVPNPKGYRFAVK